MSTAINRAEANTSQGQFVSSRTITSDGELVKNPLLPAAKVGALTTRTSDSAGELTMVTGHGIATGNRLDVYWTKPDGTQGYRYGITVGTVSVESVPLSGGAGDVLPADETAITAMVPRLEAFVYDKDDVVAFFAGASVPCVIVVRDSVPANLLVVLCDGSTDAYIWDNANGVTSPFTADLVSVYLSHGSPSQAISIVALAYVN